MRSSENTQLKFHLKFIYSRDERSVVNTGVLNVTLVERNMFFRFSLNFIWRKDGGSMAHFGTVGDSLSPFGFRSPRQHPRCLFVWPERPQLLNMNSYFLAGVIPPNSVLHFDVLLMDIWNSEDQVQVHTYFKPPSCSRTIQVSDFVRYHYNGTFLDGTLFDSR